MDFISSEVLFLLSFPIPCPKLAQSSQKGVFVTSSASLPVSVLNARIPDPLLCPKVETHPKDLGKKTRSGRSGVGPPILENGPLQNLGICPCLGNPTHHPYPNQRSERSNGRADPKRSVSQETRSKQNSGYQQLGNGGAEGQGVSCPRAREKRTG